MSKIKLLDTFAGVGGFHLALEQSIGKENIECIGFSEIDKFAKQVYSERFPGSKDLGSITELDIEALEDFDLLTGGFPCQDVSVAGKQNLDGGRTVLVEYLLQILETKKPKYFVFENVKGLMSKKFDTFRDSIFERIVEAGYNLEFKILNTKDFGLPQNRERVFMVGALTGIGEKGLNEFEFPKGQELTTFLKDILEEEVDEKYYLNQKSWDSLVNFRSMQQLSGNICRTLTTMQGGNSQPKIKVEIPEKFIRPEYLIDSVNIKNATNKGYIEATEGDGVNLSFPDSKTRRGRVGKNVSGTLMCNDMNGVITKNLGIRKLTPNECSRLQGFPDNWSTDIVSNSQAYKQMGNAISVPVVKAIFNNLFK